MPIETVDETFEELLKKGDLAVDNKELEKAKIYLDKALLLQPENPIVYDSMGRYLYAIKEFEQAEGCFKKSLAIDPEYLGGYFTLAMFYKLMKKYELSIDLFEKLLELETDNLNRKLISYKHLGDMYYQLEQYDKAEQAYKLSVANDSKNIDILIKLAQSLCWQNKLDEGLKIFDDILPLAKDNNLTNIYYFLGKIHSEKEEYKLAIQYLEKHVDLSPDSYNGFKLLTDAYAYEGNDYAALDAAKQAVNLDPDNTWDWVCIGRIYVNIGNYDLAIDSYLQSLKIKKNEAAYYYLSKLYCIIGELDTAIEYTHEALLFDAEEPRTYCIAAIAKLKLERFEEAIKDIEKAVKYANKSVEDLSGIFQDIGNFLPAEGFSDLANQCFGSELGERYRSDRVA